MSKLFTIARLKVAWKIIRPALGVLTIAAPGTREAKIATVVMAVVAKNSSKNKKMAIRYQQALIAKSRLEQLVKMYKLELESGQQSNDKLLASVGGVMETKEVSDAPESGQAV